MAGRIDADGWELRRASDDILEELMSWFGDAASTNAWGGPKFRYPFTRDTFLEDCHWHSMLTYSLHDPEGRFTAFGQVYNRNGRINLARLVAHPGRRGQGVGRRLVERLMQSSAAAFDLDEYSLFVYRDNVPALACYRALGFVVSDFPPGEELADVCYYMTRPVER